VALTVALAVCASATPGRAQGVEVETGAVVLYGSASNTSHPATVDMKKVEKKTPEHQTMKAEGVRKGSARYEILVAKMHKRIKQAAKAAAEEQGCDCVLRKGDIKDGKGMQIEDLTSEVIEQLEADSAP
jgi:Skp family chaperone for outer membrane proteins